MFRRCAVNYRHPNENYELWDSWVVEHDGMCHLFHLCRDWWSEDGIRRNYIGHATSMDLLQWVTHGNIALFAKDEREWDSTQRILTGNCFRDTDGTWYMTYGSAKPDVPGSAGKVSITACCESLASCPRSSSHWLWRFWASCSAMSAVRTRALSPKTHSAF